MNPILPSLLAPSRRRLTAAWAGSTAVAALLVSGLAALAMSLETPGNSLGDDAIPVLLNLPVPAVEAMTEPSPDVATAPPSAAAAPPEAEEQPDTPALTEAPDMPAAVAAPAPDLAELRPEIEPPPPAPVALPKPAPKPEPEPKPEPVKKAEKKTDKKKAEAPKKTAKAEKSKTPAKEKTAKEKSEASAGASAAKPKAAAKSAGAGTGSAANYGATVMKKINRTRKKAGSARGKVVIAFTVGDGGGLAALSVAASSGNPALDQAALDHTRRAAPFPPPPPGAQRSFNYTFSVK